MDKDFKLEEMEKFILGKTIIDVEYDPHADEGFIFTLTDGSKLIIGFSNSYGEITYRKSKLNL